MKKNKIFLIITLIFAANISTIFSNHLGFKKVQYGSWLENFYSLPKKQRKKIRLVVAIKMLKSEYELSTHQEEYIKKAMRNKLTE